MSSFLSDEIVGLRAVEPTDAKQMWVMETDPRQWAQNGMAAPYSQANLLDYACNYSASPYEERQLRLIVELHDKRAEDEGASNHDPEPETVGLLDLFDLSPINHTAFIGIYIREEHRLQGYAGRALRLAEEYARDMLNIRIIAAKVMDCNKASHALFHSAGYETVGVLKGWLQVGRHFHDMTIYEKQLLQK